MMTTSVPRSSPLGPAGEFDRFPFLLLPRIGIVNDVSIAWLFFRYKYAYGHV